MRVHRSPVGFRAPVVTELMNRLGALPFAAFEIVMNHGAAYCVASPDHAHFTEGKTCLVVLFDDETSATVPMMQVAAILPKQCP